MDSIKIKNKNAAGIQVIVDQPEHLEKVRRIRYIIHGIADAQHRAHRAVQFERPHILQKIKDIVPGRFFLLHGDLQHIRGIIHTDHIIAEARENLRHGPGAAPQIQQDPVVYVIFT